MSTHEDKVSKSEARILALKEVNEQIRSYIVPLTKQLEDLTRLIWGIFSAEHRNIYPGQVPALVLVQPVTRPTLRVHLDAIAF